MLDHVHTGETTPQGTGGEEHGFVDRQGPSVSRVGTVDIQQLMGRSPHHLVRFHDVSSFRWIRSSFLKPSHRRP
jgi:hypothetical protein